MKTEFVPQSIPFEHRLLVQPRFAAIGTCIFWILIVFILFFLILPTLIVIPMSLGSEAYIQFPPHGLTLKWYSAFFQDADWLAATWFSLKIALGTTIMATTVGTLASLAFVRGYLPGRQIVQALALSPLVVPHVLIAVALYPVFAPIGLTGSLSGFMIAHTMLAVPYVVLTVTAALQQVDPSLEMAALNCGASRSQAFRLVTLPNILPGVATGAVFAFLASFDEATVAFFLSGLGGKTITRKMFEDIDFNQTPVIAAAATIILVVSLTLAGGAEILRRRRMH